MEGIRSVSEITSYIMELMENDPYLTDVWVYGEVSNCKIRNSHIFFSLKDEEAKLNCVIFGGESKGIRLVEGSVIAARGDVKVYPPHGTYRMICEEVRSIGMEGLYSMRYKRVLERMIREGWLTKPKKKLPEYPRKIGVITSRDSAAFQDMLKTIRERYPFVEIYLFHTQVQGEGAKKTLIEAIERSKKYDLDLVIIARGGGSQEDLWIFNEEEVVEALVGIEPPVITGIGHEVDRVLIDLVADFPAHTPTAAAEMAVPNVKEVYRELKETFERIKREFLEKFEDFERKLEDIKRSLWVYQRIFLFRMREYENILISMREEMLSVMMRRIEEFSQKIENAGRVLESLDPKKPLNRGFAMIFKNGKLITSSLSLKKGDRVCVVMKDGDREAVIE